MPPGGVHEPWRSAAQRGDDRACADVASRLVHRLFLSVVGSHGWSNPRSSATRRSAAESSDPVDLGRVMSEARAAGLDALVVSWAGKDFNDQIDHRRMVTCLTAAESAGTKIARCSRRPWPTRSTRTGSPIP